jgi:tRNA/tmRNA/rRNA uracil-C5-methylase (TrmA/RlmC/RlmD family)
VARAPKEPIEVDDEVRVVLGAMVHGGHCLAHPLGHTAFVRHGLPGEDVTLRITEVRSKFVRADVVEVHQASEFRVEPPCNWARPNGCGGCDYQHIDLTHQRELKGVIARESLQRQAGIDVGEIQVLDLGNQTGLGWRSRMRWSVDGSGNAGLLGARSHGVLPIDTCLLASAEITSLNVTEQEWPGVESVQATEDSLGNVSVWADRDLVTGNRKAEQVVRDRTWQIESTGFWQVHPNAAASIVDHVLDFGQPKSGENWLDLYAGAGLISAFLGEAVGAVGSVTAVESYRSAVRDGRRALSDLPQVKFVDADVEQWPMPAIVDGVVLDPPRRGAGIKVMESVASSKPRVIIYVACDPMAFARDAAFLVNSGYELTGFVVLDAFPMTQHMECIAKFTPVASA